MSSFLIKGIQHEFVFYLVTLFCDEKKTVKIELTIIIYWSTIHKFLSQVYFPAK